MDIEKLIAKIKEYNPESNEDLIRLAFDYAKKLTELLLVNQANLISLTRLQLP